MDEEVINYPLIEALIQYIHERGDASFKDVSGNGNGAILVFLPGFMEISTLYDLLSTNRYVASFSLSVSVSINAVLISVIQRYERQV